MKPENFTEHSLAHVLVFNLDVRLFSGRRRVTPADIQAAQNVVIKSDDVFSLGSKRVFPQDRINALTRNKAEMERQIRRVGTPFLGAFGVPESRSNELARVLDELVAKGNAIRADIVDNYEDYVAKFAEIKRDSPGYRDVIAKNSFDKTYVEKAIYFGWNAVKVHPGAESGTIADRLVAEVNGLEGALFMDIAKAAEKLIDESLLGKAKITRKALRPLVAIRDKLDGFGFLNPRVTVVSSMITEMINQIPREGDLGQADFLKVLGVAELLAKPEKALEIAERMNGSAPADALMIAIGNSLPAGGLLTEAASASTTPGGFGPAAHAEPEQVSGGPDGVVAASGPLLGVARARTSAEPESQKPGVPAIGIPMAPCLPSHEHLFNFG